MPAGPEGPPCGPMLPVVCLPCLLGTGDAGPLQVGRHAATQASFTENGAGRIMKNNPEKVPSQSCLKTKTEEPKIGDNDS